MSASIRPPNFSESDTPADRTRRLVALADDLRQWSARSPRAFFRQVSVSAAGEVTGQLTVGSPPVSVSVARVISGTVNGAPFVDWAPTGGAVGQITARAVYGVTGPAVLILKVEV